MIDKGSPPAATGGRQQDVTRRGVSVQEDDTTKGKGGQAVYNAQGRPVGRIVDGWLVKTGLDPARHMLRKPSGWCTDAEHLRLPIVGVRLLCADGTCWEARLEVWQRYGQPLDRGFGPQLALAARFWTVHRPGVRQLGFALGGVG